MRASTWTPIFTNTLGPVISIYLTVLKMNQVNKDTLHVLMHRNQEWCSSSTTPGVSGLIPGSLSISCE